MTVQAVEKPEWSTPEREPVQRVQLLDRAFELLELMAAAGGEISLSELSQQSGLPIPSTHRTVRSMVMQGYARQLKSKRYALGPRLIRLGDAASRILGSCASPHLNDLVEQTGETASMAILDGAGATIISQVPSRYSMRAFIEVGRTTPLHCTSIGKALMTCLKPSQLRQLIARTGMTRYTDRTIVDLEVLLAQVEEVRNRGYALEDSEFEVGLRSVAVPLPDAPVPIALSISGPDSRLTENLIAKILPELQSAAGEILTCT